MVGKMIIAVRVESDGRRKHIHSWYDKQPWQEVLSFVRRYGGLYREVPVRVRKDQNTADKFLLCASRRVVEGGPLGLEIWAVTETGYQQVRNLTENICLLEEKDG